MSSVDYLQQQFPPLIIEALESILGRLITDANAGLAPTDPQLLDLTAGSIANDMFVAASIELDRLWDFAANEVPRTGIPTLAQGPYLDSWAEAVKLARKDQAAATGQVTFTGDAGTILNAGTKVSTEATEPDSDPQVFTSINGAVIDSSLGIPAGGTVAQGVATLNVVADEPGAAGNVLANTITLVLSITAGVASLTNTAPTAGGADVESDDQLQVRVGQALAGSEGSGTISDYERWLLAEPSVGFVTVQPCWAGPTTVRNLITDVNNNPFTSPAFVTALQAKYDPTPGIGAGVAPIGHFVTIATPVAAGVNVAASVAFEPGFSYDGTGGTQALRATITAAIQAYVTSLAAGEDPIYYKVAAAIMDVEGVANLTALTLWLSTTLTAPAIIGATSLVVANSDGFTSGESVAITGSASDTRTLSAAPADQTHLTIGSGLTYAHAAGDAVSAPAVSTDLTVGTADQPVLNTVLLS